MSRATICDTTGPEAEEIAMEVIETADVLGDFPCTIRPVAEDAGILVSPAQPSGDEVSVVYRSAYWYRHQGWTGALAPLVGTLHIQGSDIRPGSRHAVPASP